MNPIDPTDERALLIRLELLLEREGVLLAARDAAGLADIADERERLIVALGEVAHARRAAAGPTAEEAELLALYRRLRDRHAVQVQVVRLHGERNARAISVLAQATGSNGLYQADGRVALRFVSI